MEKVVVNTRSAEETELLGACLGQVLVAGDVITLSGNLGGGKTCMARGIVSAVAPQSIDQVSSPTFAIMNEYAGAIPVYHFDFYRLRGADDCYELGFDEYLSADGICLIEWPERASGLISNSFIEISFRAVDENNREITFIPHGDKALATLRRLSLKP